jgi:hypothetical protein
MTNEEHNKKPISDSHERFREEHTIEENKHYYRGNYNGLASDEDDLPDRNLASEFPDEDEYIDEP